MKYIDMKTKLLPCPFCGERAELMVNDLGDDFYEFTPRCKNPSCAGRLIRRWRNKSMAIEAWNKRYSVES